jgi:hypothetical protein
MNNDNDPEEHISQGPVLLLSNWLNRRDVKNKAVVVFL